MCIDSLVEFTDLIRTFRLHGVKDMESQNEKILNLMFIFV